MIILGIDPGTARLGYGVIEVDTRSARAVDFGCIETSKEWKSAERLLFLRQAMEKIIQKHQPERVGVEKIFFAKNSKTALGVGEARGVVLACIAEAGILVCEMTPMQVKSAVTGYGLADKKQMQKMVQMIFKLQEIPKPDDAADALAIALTASRM
ncbi:MAG: crossover junction endodeoxyribonuclease RuvC [Patescibacteria group bacterium]